MASVFSSSSTGNVLRRPLNFKNYYTGNLSNIRLAQGIEVLITFSLIDIFILLYLMLPNLCSKSGDVSTSLILKNKTCYENGKRHLIIHVRRNEAKKNFKKEIKLTEEVSSITKSQSFLEIFSIYFLKIIPCAL